MRKTVAICIYVILIFIICTACSEQSVVVRKIVQNDDSNIQSADENAVIVAGNESKAKEDQTTIENRTESTIKDVSINLSGSNATSTDKEEAISEITDEIVQPAEQFFTDWNKDGVKDLVRKEADGTYLVFPNYGTDDNPIYNESYVYEK